MCFNTKPRWTVFICIALLQANVLGRRMHEPLVRQSPVLKNTSATPYEFENAVDEPDEVLVERTENRKFYYEFKRKHQRNNDLGQPFLPKHGTWSIDGKPTNNAFADLPIQSSKKLDELWGQIFDHVSSQLLKIHSANLNSDQRKDLRNEMVPKHESWTSVAKKTLSKVQVNRKFSAQRLQHILTNQDDEARDFVIPVQERRRQELGRPEFNPTGW